MLLSGIATNVLTALGTNAYEFYMLQLTLLSNGKEEIISYAARVYGCSVPTGTKRKNKRKEQ